MHTTTLSLGCLLENQLTSPLSIRIETKQTAENTIGEMNESGDGGDVTWIEILGVTHTYVNNQQSTVKDMSCQTSLHSDIPYRLTEKSYTKTDIPHPPLNLYTQDAAYIPQQPPSRLQHSAWPQNADMMAWRRYILDGQEIRAREINTKLRVEAQALKLKLLASQQCVFRLMVHGNKCLCDQ